MKSSFKKVEKPTVSQRCVFGHPDFDAIFANSISKGHLMVIEEDHPSLPSLPYFSLSCFSGGLSRNFQRGELS